MSAAVYANITQEQRKLLSNLSLSNEYVVEVNLPGKLINFLKEEEYIPRDDTFDIDIYELSLLCSDASLPGSTFATAEVKDNFMGVNQEFAHTRLYTDIDLTFYVDKKYRILELFQGWTDFISGGSGKDVAQNSYSKGFYRRFRYPDDYKTDISIAKLERDYRLESADNFYSRTYNLVNSFPKSVASIPVSYGPADILKITVTFNYDRYTISKENKSTTKSVTPTENSTSTSSIPETNTTSGRPTSGGRLGVLRVKEAKGTITPQELRELQQLQNK
jgi:hypothetical protein